MKRYIRSSDVNATTSAQEYINHVEQAINQSKLGSLIAKIEWQCAYNHDESDATDWYCECTLKDPYKCRYYHRWKQYLNWFEIISDRGFICSGSPDTYFYLKPNQPEDSMVVRCEEFADKILKITSESKEVL